MKQHIEIINGQEVTVKVYEAAHLPKHLTVKSKGYCKTGRAKRRAGIARAKHTPHNTDNN